MKILATSVLFLCFVEPMRGQSEVDGETEVMADSSWWSRRITKIDRKFMGLDGEDSARRDLGRWRDGPGSGDTGRRPRPFSSSSASRSKKARFPIDLSIPPEPSPILLPPFATPSPVFRLNLSDSRENAMSIALRGTNDESSSNKTGKPSAALERVQIYEITAPRNATPITENKVDRFDDDSAPNYLSGADDESPRWINENNANETIPESFGSFEIRKMLNNRENFEINNNSQDSIRDVNSRNESDNETTNVDVFTNRYNLVKTYSRGSRKYQDYFYNERASTRKRMFSEYSRYDSRRRNGRRFHYFTLGDEDSAVGSVPGIPGRDYPIHQEHTHHHLRNRIVRFPCPKARKSQIYLPDRASRCQIFYVCYGSKTGVPMVCPNGTLFSETLQVCDWWYNVSC